MGKVDCAKLNYEPYFIQVHISGLEGFYNEKIEDFKSSIQFCNVLHYV
jgi:hypothetical protein